MIKPASLWGLFKTCESSEWLGAVCRALGGQEVTLDFGQQQAVRMISLDSGWLDEAVEAKREKWRERQKAHRAKDGAEQDAEGSESVTCHNVTPVTHGGVTPRCHALPSVLPSVLPSHSTSVECEREGARSRVVVVGNPDLKTVVGSSKLMGIPDWYAGWWWHNMEASGWVKTNGAPVGLDNWRAVLKAWWNRADEKEQARIQADIRAKDAEKTAQERVYGAEDWVLCLERCLRCTGHSCASGVKVPPALQERPISPEECPKFKAVEE